MRECVSNVCALILVLAMALLVQGCAEPVCDPGATQLCTCDGSDAGAQICEEGGDRWGPCDCGGGGDDDDVIGDDDDVIDDDDAADDDAADDDDDAAPGCEDAAVDHDFESGDQGFSHSQSDAGFDDPWELGIPAEQACHSGDACWTTRLDGDYGDCEAGALVSPTLDLSACAGEPDDVALTFWHLFRFEAGTQAHYDGGAVQISADAGLTWTDVTPDPAYTGTIEGTYDECGGTPTINGLEGWSAVIEGDDWVQVRVEIADEFRTDGFRARFLFGSDRGVTDQGWYVDDAAVEVE